MASIKMNMDLARNDLARVFLFRDGIYKVGGGAEFLNALGVDGLSQDRGDITSIEAPSPIRYGEFVEVSALPGEVSRMTTSLSGRMSRTELSAFYSLFNDNCKFDLHLHFGQCQRPDDFNQYDKVMVLEDVFVTSFSTDPLVAIQSGDRAAINESIDISIGSFYEIVSLIYSSRATGQILATDGPIAAVRMCDIKSCGDACTDRSNGCLKGFAVTNDGFIFSTVDGGQSWTRLAMVNNQSAAPVSAIVDMICYQENVIVLDAAGNFWYADREELLAGNVTQFNVQASGLTVGNAIDSFLGTAVAVGNSGQVVVMKNQTIATFTSTVLGAQNLLAVNISQNGYIVAVGANGAVYFSKDGSTWNTATAPANQSLTSVVVKSDTNWIVGAANGSLWATDNRGVTWSQISYPDWLTASTPVNDLTMSTPHVLWMAQGTRLLRSIDGGTSWTVEPNNRTASITAAEITAVGSCLFDPNFILVGGAIGSPTQKALIVSGSAI